MNKDGGSGHWDPIIRPSGGGTPGPGSLVLADVILGYDPSAGALTYRDGQGIASVTQGIISATGITTWIVTPIDTTTPAVPLMSVIEQTDHTTPYVPRCDPGTVPGTWEVYLFDVQTQMPVDPTVIPLHAIDGISFALLKGGLQSGTLPILKPAGLVATSTTYETIFHFQQNGPGNWCVYYINPTNGSQVWQDYAQTIPGVFGQPAQLVDDNSPSANNYETAPGHVDATWTNIHNGMLHYGGLGSDTIGRTVSSIDFHGSGLSTGTSITFLCDIDIAANQPNNAGFYEALNPGEIYFQKNGANNELDSFFSDGGIHASRKIYDGTPVFGAGLVCLTQRIGLTNDSHDVWIATDGVDAAPLPLVANPANQDPGSLLSDILLFGLGGNVLLGSMGPMVIVCGRRITDAEIRDLSRHLLALGSPNP